ncbi:alpha-soluble NSF attachment protein-like [Paramacrobiotus metropolitanus]|uniref:alpha-soluble NSF attachment protein-like n=1 Tax=Paramacrobiotus metropolitanus TaxID=2943436 RepID=UPI0024460126|nr:alpha-soluble NSF attachment protein-like [Paramacrobiotus metropolitanus]
MTAPAAQNLDYDMTPEEGRARTLVTAARTAVAHGDQLLASHLYRRAGNLFKLDRRWQWAGIAYQEAGERKAPFEVDARPDPSLTLAARQGTAIGLLKTASDCFVKDDNPHEAVGCLQTAAELLMDGGDFTTSAGYFTALGLMVAPLHVDAGIRFYEKAVRLHEAATGWYGRLCARPALLGIGELLAQKGDYTAAINHFEGLIKHHAKEIPGSEIGSGYSGSGAALTVSAAYFRAVLCYLCRDGPVAAQEAVQQWDATLPPAGTAYNPERHIMRHAMGTAENRFTAANVARVLRPASSGSSSVHYAAGFGQMLANPLDNYEFADLRGVYPRLEPWARMMLERALRLLRDVEDEGHR